VTEEQREAARQRAYQWRVRRLASDPEAFRAAERARIAARRERRKAGEDLPIRPTTRGLPRERRSPAVRQADIALLMPPAAPPSPPTIAEPLLTTPSLRERLRARCQQSGRRLVHA
jgi:hypothetical protein